MLVALGLLVALCCAAGFYMLLRRSLVKVVFGIALLGHGANLLLFAAGRARGSNVPIVPEGAEAPPLPFADPTPQALVLTAIVIGFAVQAFALVLVRRLAAVAGTGDGDGIDESAGAPEAGP